MKYPTKIVNDVQQEIIKQHFKRLSPGAEKVDLDEINERLKIIERQIAHLIGQWNEGE